MHILYFELINVFFKKPGSNVRPSYTFKRRICSGPVSYRNKMDFLFIFIDCFGDWRLPNTQIVLHLPSDWPPGNCTERSRRWSDHRCCRGRSDSILGLQTCVSRTRRRGSNIGRTGWTWTLSRVRTSPWFPGKTKKWGVFNMPGEVTPYQLNLRIIIAVKSI